MNYICSTYDVYIIHTYVVHSSSVTLFFINLVNSLTSFKMYFDKFYGLQL